MQYQRFQETYLVRMDRGEEIMQSLAALCRQEEIRLAQVDAIGAADHAVIGIYDPEEQAYHPEELNCFMEITSLTGNVTRMNGEPYIHLHATLADGNHTVHGGHVTEMQVGATCEMFVRVIGGEVGREHDDGIGINLWQFREGGK